MANHKIVSAPDSAALAELISRASADAGGSARGLPPVEQWNPPFCGEIDMEIRADGRWFYMGTPIHRAPLVRLFSTVLRRDEDNQTYLVTPVEKVAIRVEDAPFIAVEMSATGEGESQSLTFRTNVGDVIEGGPDHPLRFVQDGQSTGFKPYLHVRGRLEALLTRALAFDLVSLGEIVQIDHVEMFCIRSRGTVFPVISRLELDKMLD